MNRIISCCLVGIVTLGVIATAADAADGCGRGMFYNGRRCVPMDGPGYGSRDRGPAVQFNLGGGRDEGRYSAPNPRFRTFNNCPQGYTVQDGVCKPYRGR
jgi:hypothetical protein